METRQNGGENSAECRKVIVRRCESNVDDLTDLMALDLCDTETIRTNWNGMPCSPERAFEVWLGWNDSGLLAHFSAVQHEPLVISNKPQLDAKTIGLWERDVCEIFIAPDRNEPRRYFEFEVAPTGEWLDLAIDLTSGERITDWEYNSGMKATASIEDGRVLMAMKIPWEAFGRSPKPGDVWLGNIFRCVGAGETRGYLAWRPTLTERPDFHVPSAFGEFVFMSEPAA